MARFQLPRLSAALCRCLLVLVAIGSSCRLSLATGRGALPADKQQASSYERDDHDHTKDKECRADGAVCSRARQCCSNTCLQHTCWSHAHHRPPCRNFSEPCWDSEDCCGALVCGQVGYHPYPVCCPRQPGPVDVCPVVTVTPPRAPVFVCETSTATDVAVAFNVSTDTNAPVDLPANITATDGRNCSLKGTSTSVPSGSAVEYSCPQLNGTWSPPGSFKLMLTASAGPVGCTSTSATATITIFAPTCTPFDFTAGWQKFTVPAGVSSIRIDAYGAQGASAKRTTAQGGKGARMSGLFAAAPGDNLIILVGGEGAVVDSNGGGGGGSFVVRVNSSATDVITDGPFAGTPVTPLLIAGGGGGVGVFAEEDAWPGQTGQFGTFSSGTGVTGGGVPKTSGAGEGGSAGNSGSGGGGFQGNGTGGVFGTFSSGTGGRALVSGGAGGVTFLEPCPGGGSDVPSGGFGGGGSCGCTGVGGGGGGGYSGGDGGRVAGGAGSFNAGDEQFNIPGNQTDRIGNGNVSICVVCK